MHIKNVSIRNFGPFSDANFAFSDSGISVVLGSNATGKTQLCGAIVAAIVGRSAIHINEGDVGPSKVELTLADGDSLEVATLAVTEASPGEVAVSHVPCPLAMQIMATMSDPDGPRLLFSDESMRRNLGSSDLGQIEQHLPIEIVQSPTWTRLSRRALVERTLSGGEDALFALLCEVAVRRKLNSHIPLLVDSVAQSWDRTTHEFAAVALRSICETSQVIVFTTQAIPLINEAVFRLPDTRNSAPKLAAYNYRSFAIRPKSRLRKNEAFWTRGRKFPQQESRSCELKEVKGVNPVGSIKAVVDQYAVAFMNAGHPQDGSIFWGIRDEDLSIVGVPLNDRDCDELRRVVTEKLHQIVPPIAPTSYQIELHPVSDGGRPVRDLYVVEVKIPAVRRTLLFATGSQEIYVKTDGGKRKLSAVEIQYELLRRVGVDPAF